MRELRHWRNYPRKLLIAMTLGFCCAAHAELIPHEAKLDALQEDLQLILKEAGFALTAIDFERETFGKKESKRNLVIIECRERGVHLKVNAQNQEWASTFYFGLQKLGFLFPHPRIQVSPKWEQIRWQCGRTYEWKPRLNYRGFHLHTQHPSEWVNGFLMGNRSIADSMIRWLARNGQNVVNLVLLRTIERRNLEMNLKEPFALAKSLGILTGINVSFNMQQQKSFKLIDILQTKSKIHSSIEDLVRGIAFDFMTIELGSSEFTSNDYRETLSWIEAASEALYKAGRQVFFKVHVSSNQMDPRYGNYNFLPQFASNSVGIWPHTVMFYGLQDQSTPVYGRRDFSDIKNFAVVQKDKRLVWYYPETSYYIAMDIDVPLFLTDYLVARSQDMDFLEDVGIMGQINFSTGQELGYWLMDWTVALLTNSEYRGRALIALELLGEDLNSWKPIIDFQTHFFKEQGLISILSSTTPLDEVPWFGHSVHERVLLKNLGSPDQRYILKSQIELLEKAVEELPSLNRIRNRELRLMLEVTWARVRHALFLRRALLGVRASEQRISSIEKAKSIRIQALHWMEEIQNEFNRYPEARIFYKNENPTSYSYGYGWTAAQLHYWIREERMVLEDNYSPFFMNIYDLLKILF